MYKNISAYSYPVNTRRTPFKFRSVIICCLLPVVCLLAFISCATTPNTKDTKRAEAYNKLGVSYLQNDQMTNAYVQFQKALDLNPNNKETLNYLGYINTTYKKYDEAIAQYKKAISIDREY